MFGLSSSFWLSVCVLQQAVTYSLAIYCYGGLVGSPYNITRSCSSFPLVWEGYWNETYFPIAACSSNVSSSCIVSDYLKDLVTVGFDKSPLLTIKLTFRLNIGSVSYPFRFTKIQCNRQVDENCGMLDVAERPSQPRCNLTVTSEVVQISCKSDTVAPSGYCTMFHYHGSYRTDIDFKSNGGPSYGDYSSITCNSSLPVSSLAPGHHTFFAEMFPATGRFVLWDSGVFSNNVTTTIGNA